MAPRAGCHGCADLYTYRRFLRARQHDLARAKAMWHDHLAWRKEYEADTILDNFHFHERDAFISLYPQGYHKTDKMVSARRKRRYVYRSAQPWQPARGAIR
jgi:hypothetical protein